jgi:hypothetical protein
MHPRQRPSSPLVVALAACLLHCGGRSSIDDVAPRAPPGLDAATPRDAGFRDSSPPSNDAPIPFADARLPRFDAWFPLDAPPDLVDCFSCRQLACTDAYVQCAEDSACVRIYDCLLPNLTDCVCQAPEGANAYFALLQCIQAVDCSPGECTIACGGGHLSYPLPSDSECGTPLRAPLCNGRPVDAGRKGSPGACEACVTTLCPTQAAACGPECAGYVIPFMSGGGALDGGGAPAALEACLARSCAAECSF